MHPLSSPQILLLGLLVDLFFLAAVLILGVVHVLPPEAVVGLLGTVSGARAVSRGSAGFPGPPEPPRAAGVSPGVAAGGAYPTWGRTSGVGALVAALRAPVLAFGRWVKVSALTLSLCLASCAGAATLCDGRPCCPATPEDGPDLDVTTPRVPSPRPAVPVPADACAPAPAPFALSLGQSVTVTGSTVSASDDFDSFCGDVSPAQDAPDLVYAFTLPEAGTLRVEVTALSPGFNPALEIRVNCPDPFACFDFGAQREAFAAHFPAGTYFFIVDGAAGTSGAFQLEVSFSEPICGDGVVNPGEACDVGPGRRGDGCVDPEHANECQLEPAGADDLCPGTAVTVPLGSTILHGSTIGYANDYSGSRAIPPGGRDRVYQVTPAATGTLEVRVGLGPDGVTDVCAADFTAAGCWDRALYARTTCADPAAELAYSDNGATDVETIAFPVTAGVPVFVFVDGYDGEAYSAGPFDLLLELH